MTYFTKQVWLLLTLVALSVLTLSCKKDEESPAPTPTITSFTPTNGAMGTQVVITGTNFSATAANNTVQFNGKSATVTAATATQLTVTVPEKAGDGAVTVAVGGKTASGAAFDYLETVTVTTFAGSGTEGYRDGPGAQAQFAFPRGIAIDGSGNLYVGDGSNNRIRQVTPAGVVSTLAGSGTYGFADGPAAQAQFDGPDWITIDGSGNLYVIDVFGNPIRKITPAGMVSTLAGGTYGFADGPAAQAGFRYPQGIAIDGWGSLYVGDEGSNRIRKITSGVVTTFAGSVTAGYRDGSATEAQFEDPQGVAIDGSGNLYVGDAINNRIRKITIQ